MLIIADVMSMAHVRDSKTTPVVHPDAHWSLVGASGDEVVVLRDGGGGNPADTRAYVVRGALAVAWWTRMDGLPEHDARSLVAEAARAAGLALESYDPLFEQFTATLASQGLIAWH